MASISIVEFLAETKDDFNSPTTSTFTSKMGLCRNAISSLEESLDADRSSLKKMKSAVKAMCNSGETHGTNEENFIENLEKLGAQAFNNSKEPEPDIGAAFLKLAVFTKELTSLLKNLISNFNRIVIYPLESLLKGDLKGIKGDMKRPFDKSWKDYDTKVKQVEREKRQLAKEAGMIRNEISGGEIAEEMEKERRMFQLQMCDYLIKANEIKTKKGVDLLQHLVEYYHAQNTFFNEGCRVTEQFKVYFTELSANLHSIRQSQDEERRQLVELRNLLRSAVGDQSSSKPGPGVYNLHQLQGLKEYGNEKVGSLLKRSEGLRKAWQKRKCTVSDGFLTISHNNMSKAPVKLNLLTSQVKPFPEDKRIFDLVSHNRTYRFMADDEAEAIAWVSVISNSKEDALNRVFGEEGVSKEQNSGLKELTKSIIDEVKHLPGNKKCCDCGTDDPTWLSTNLGVLICIECSGIHRDMGVHISRIQSITLDELGTSELLIAMSMGNNAFNEVMESKLDPHNKLDASSDMEARKTFIRDKYEMHRFATQTCLDDQETLQRELIQAIQNNDMSILLQVFAEGVDLNKTLPGSDNEETALQFAISEADRTTLPLVDFLVQNSSSSLNKQTLDDGNTPLHLCAKLNKTECMKLLLRTRAKVDIKNSYGETPIETARKMGHTSCEELLTQASAGKFHPVVHVDVDWNFSYGDEDDDEFPHDNSDDDLDGDKTEKTTSSVPQFNSPFKTPGPVPSVRSRPVSAINPGVPFSTASSTPENTGRSRPTSFKDRHRPSIPGTNHGLLSPSNPIPPPKPTLPSPNVANINRNRSRTVAPVAGLREHKRTSSETKATATSFPVHQGRNAGVSHALENLLRAPPPLPPHNPPPASRPMPPAPSLASRPLPTPTSTQESRKDSFNESSSKGATKNFLSKKYSKLKSRRKPRSASENVLAKTNVQPPSPVPPALPDKMVQQRELPPPPLPRSSGSGSRPRRVKAIFDCDADNPDELTFVENEIIVVTGVEDPEWWVGHIDHQPHRTGVFPVSFVQSISD